MPESEVLVGNVVNMKEEKLLVCFDSRGKYCEGCAEFDRCFEAEMESARIVSYPNMMVRKIDNLATRKGTT